MTQVYTFLPRLALSASHSKSPGLFSWFVKSSNPLAIQMIPGYMTRFLIDSSHQQRHNFQIFLTWPNVLTSKIIQISFFKSRCTFSISIENWSMFKCSESSNRGLTLFAFSWINIFTYYVQVIQHNRRYIIFKLLCDRF